MEQLNADGTSVTVIHHMLPASNGKWYIACMPNMTEFHTTQHHPHYQRSDDIRAVTCQACKKAKMKESGPILRG